MRVRVCMHACTCTHAYLDDAAHHQRDVNGLGAEVVAHHRHVRHDDGRQLLARLVHFVVRGPPAELGWLDLDPDELERLGLRARTEYTYTCTTRVVSEIRTCVKYAILSRAHAQTEGKGGGREHERGEMERERKKEREREGERGSGREFVCARARVL